MHAELVNIGSLSEMKTHIIHCVPNMTRDFVILEKKKNPLETVYFERTSYNNKQFNFCHLQVFLKQK